MHGTNAPRSETKWLCLMCHYALPHCRRTKQTSCEPKLAEKLPVASGKSFWAIKSRTLHDVDMFSPRSAHSTLI
eukprot:COSAG02_NODE_57326_length_281_cov_0.571429_1_plen_73_part_01